MHDDTSFDPTLVHRLSRRALRPGVTDPGQARTVLTRHGDMTPGLPLAELPSRYVDPVPQHAGSTEPIVYARPASPGPSGPSATGADAVGPGAPAGSTPVVSARPATAPGDGPMASAHPAVRTGADVGNAGDAGDAVRTPARPGTGGSPMRSSSSPSVSSPSVRGTPTIQRKVAAPPAAPARPPAGAGSGPSPTPRVPGPLAKRGGPGALGPAPADPSGPPARTKPHVQGHGPVMAYLPSAPGHGPGAPVTSRLAAPSARPRKDPEASTAAPAVRPRPADDPHRVPSAPTAVPTALPHRAPVSYSGTPGAEPLAAPTEVVSARRPRAQPVRTLPLATAGTASHDRPSPGTAAGWQAAGVLPQPVPSGPAHTAAPALTGSESLGGHPQRADRGTSPSPRPEVPQVDVARITDQVHQRIVRRLAVEAERRGVRR